MSLYVVFFISYAVGTVLGIWFGYKHGVKQGADATLELLMSSKFLLYKRQRNGDIEFIKPEKPAEMQ